MSKGRLEIVYNAWHHVAKGREFVSVDELRSSFRAAEHPRVTSREKTAESITAEFENGICNYVTDDNVNSDGFINYYMD